VDVADGEAAGQALQQGCDPALVLFSAEGQDAVIYQEILHLPGVARGEPWPLLVIADAPHQPPADLSDTLDYLEHDPVHRRYHHNKLTFSQLYAYNENFVLPLSHDEVVHMKRSLLDKMPGDPWQKFANLRLLLSWQMTHPGKKLLFMGGEIGQWTEWDEGSELEWSLLHYDTHRGVQALVRDLNRLYRELPALHRHDSEGQGFEWLECNDVDRSVLAFQRLGDGEHLVCLINFTPVPRHNYRVPLPMGGRYREIFNSDSAHYGGSNCGNGKVVAETYPWGGREYSAVLSLPPLGMLILQPDL
jgi:1,4-alpha-glucan branching enzyme